jgi:hypothetical protein
MNLNFTRSPQTEAIVKALRGVNGEISYKTLASAADVTVTRCKTLLASARRVLLKEKIAFGTVHGFGLRRMGDGDKVIKSEADKKKMGRVAKRGIKNLASIEAFDRLEPRQQLVVSTNRTIFALTWDHTQTKPQPQDPPPAAPETSTAAAAVARLGSN